MWRIIRWLVIAFLVIDLGMLHIRVGLLEDQVEIIWCIIYPKPPFCTLLGDQHERQAPKTPHTETY